MSQTLVLLGTPGALPLQVGALSILFALFAGCARHEGLGPANDAIVPLDHSNQAYAEEQGIQIFVDGDAWRGAPRDLERQMEVVLVRVENHGGVPIRLMYQDFKLESANQVLAPLPPLALEAPASDDAPQIVSSRTGFAARGYYLLPAYRPYYPGAEIWGSSRSFDPTFYRRMHALWKAPLPSPEMIQMALPEGVLIPGGSARGFLYFPQLSVAARGTIVFWASLPGATDDASFVNIKIALQRK
jgi:hypothetical protein